MEDTRVDVENVCRAARGAYRELAEASASRKNEALEAIARGLKNRREDILSANREDVRAAREEGLSDALVDRLELTPDRLDGMVDGVREVIELNDPVGEVLGMWERPNGLRVGQQRVPLGVIGMIYESRPNVTVDATVLCLKAGNAVLLRGGSEARRTNYLLVDVVQEALEGYLPPESVQILRDQSHDLVDEMLAQDDFLDVIIPRGGETLIRMVAEKSTVPVIKHYKGVCHVYVADSADRSMARDIVMNAKTQRPSTCNAMETLLLHEGLEEDFVEDLLGDLASSGVELRVDAGLQERFGEADFELKPASEADWDEEYLDLVLSVRTVESFEQAVDHINAHGNHSDAIVTGRYADAETFLDRVDSSAVFVNASTRFNDGYEFGLGAEIGISTDRIHARGPMGLEELTIPKYVVYGDGQLRG